MVQSLTFIDCSTCGKRIRSNATKCHHCHQSNLPSNALSSLPDSDSWVGPEALKKTTDKTGNRNADSHMASEGGGYDEDADDFDYEEYLAEEFPSHAKRKAKPRVKLWVWVTAWVLIFATLLPYLYYLVA